MILWTILSVRSMAPSQIFFFLSIPRTEFDKKMCLALSITSISNLSIDLSWRHYTMNTILTSWTAPVNKFKTAQLKVSDIRWNWPNEWMAQAQSIGLWDTACYVAAQKQQFQTDNKKNLKTNDNDLSMVLKFYLFSNLLFVVIYSGQAIWMFSFIIGSRILHLHIHNVWMCTL